jgi:hypothetical protein
MTYLRWKGTGNRARRQRIRQIRWSRREKVSEILLFALALLAAVAGGWLGYHYKD